MKVRQLFLNIWFLLNIKSIDLPEISNFAGDLAFIFWVTWWHKLDIKYLLILDKYALLEVIDIVEVKYLLEILFKGVYDNFSVANSQNESFVDIEFDGFHKF